MTLEEFGEEIKLNLLKINKNIPEDSFSFRDVTKRGRVYRGLDIKITKEFSITIDLESLMEKVKTPEEMNEAIESINEGYKNGLQHTNITEKITDLEYLKGNIVLETLPVNLNKELLENVPHRIESDFALVYKYEVPDLQTDDGFTSIQITNNISDYFKLSEQDLYNIGTSNMRESIQPVLSNLSMASLFSGTPENLLELQGKELDNLHNNLNFLVLSNKSGTLGASAMFYPDVMDKVKNILNKDFIILPSSIHEVIILPHDESVNVKELNEMVTDVNLASVSPHEILGARAYAYAGNAKEICRLDDYYKTKMQGFKKREKMSKYLTKNGIQPKEKLVDNMLSLGREQKKTITLGDIEMMDKNNKLTPRAESIVKECASQLRAMEQTPGVEL